MDNEFHSMYNSHCFGVLVEGTLEPLEHIMMYYQIERT